MKTISIITNKKVAYTFESVHCLLRRTITEEKNLNGITRFNIVTDLVNYETNDVKILDEQHNGTGEFESITELKSLEVRQTNGKKVVNELQADVLFEMIKTQVNLDNGYSAFLFKVKQLSWLLGTHQDLPYGTIVEDWILLNE